MVGEDRIGESEIELKRESVMVKVNVAASISASIDGFSGGVSRSFGIQYNEQQREMVTNTKKEQREYYIGGSPLSGDFSAGSTESLREWARSAAERPAPIQYKLSSIDSVIKPEFFKKPPTDLYDKRRCLRKALFTYCTTTIKANYCTLVTSPDSTDYGSQDIKFGDFVTVRHIASGKYLALTQNYGVAPGQTIKPLIRVPAITNYDGLYQIVPTDGYENFGSPVHYGEAFLLKSMEGDMLHMGQVTIMNNSMPSETKLQDIFTSKDQRRSSSRRSNRIEDFSIFLKQPTVASYLVSLYSECMSDWNPIIFQVDIEGSQGTLSVIVKTHCPSGGRRSTWFHALEVDYDIGDIHTVTFPDTWDNQAFTRLITQLQINTLINGEKRRVVWSGCCHGTITTISSSVLTTKPNRVIEQDTYPIQLTFHSTTQPSMIGQPVVQRDTGLIHVISSMPRRTFWDNGISQVMSKEAMGKVGIKEIGPKPHRPLSSVCRGLIFPSSTVVSNKYELFDRILISFGVNVMINYIEIAYRNHSSEFKVAYIDAENETFVDILKADIKTTQMNNTVTLEFLKSMYTTGVKIYHGDLIELRERNISNIVDTVRIGGCASAVIDVENPNITEYELKIEPSHNTIQIFPFLKIIPKESEEIGDPVLFSSSDIPVTKTENFTITLLEEMKTCSFSADVLKLYLQRYIITGSLQFKDVKLNRQAEELQVTMVVNAINKVEYDRGHMALESAIEKGIQDQKCTKNDIINIASSTGFLGTSSSQNEAESSGVTSSGTIIGFAIIGALMVLVLLVLAYNTFKGTRSQEDHSVHRLTSIGFPNRALDDYTNEEGEGKDNN